MQRRKDDKQIPTTLFRSLIAVSEHGNFTRAAEELNLTQPAVSAQIKRLERVAGGDLLIRKSHGVVLSPLGAKIECYARRILSLNDQVLGMAGIERSQETIRIGLQNVFAATMLAEVVRECHAAGTGRHPRFICGSGKLLAERLRSGYLDLVCMFPRTDSRRDLIAEWEEQLVWACARSGPPIAKNKPIPLITREEGFIHQKVADLLDDLDVPYRIAFTATDASILAAAAEAGIGVVPLPERSIPSSLILAKNDRLPKLPRLRAGVFCKEGFDLKRNRLLVDAFVAAVRPSTVTRSVAAE